MTVVKDRGKAGFWRASDVQRSSKNLLDEAKERPQAIRASDGQMLLLMAKEEADFDRGLREQLVDIAQFWETYKRNRSHTPKKWCRQTPFPFIGALSIDEVDEFAKELLIYSLDAAQQNSLESLKGNLRAWKSTAEVYEDPESLEELMTAIDPAKLAEVFPPDTVKE